MAGNLLVRGQDNFGCTGPGQWQVGGPNPPAPQFSAGVVPKAGWNGPTRALRRFPQSRRAHFPATTPAGAAGPVPYLESDPARRALRRRPTGGRMTVSAAMVRPSPVSQRGGEWNTQGTRHRLPEVEFRQRRKPLTTWPTPGSASSPLITRL